MRDSICTLLVLSKDFFITYSSVAAWGLHGAWRPSPLCLFPLARQRLDSKVAPPPLPRYSLHMMPSAFALKLALPSSRLCYLLCLRHIVCGNSLFGTHP